MAINIFKVTFINIDVYCCRKVVGAIHAEKVPVSPPGALGDQTLVHTRAGTPCHNIVTTLSQHSISTRRVVLHFKPVNYILYMWYVSVHRLEEATIL